ncbi:MAG: MBL fold metallo-hydrolase, partial [Gemmatimonadales bacterium]
MRSVSSIAIVLLTLPIAAPAAAQAPRDVVARGVTAMGGADALRAVRVTATDLYGATFALGQEETPESPARANITLGRFTTDYAGGRQLSTTEARNPGGAVIRQRRVTAGGIGMLETDGRQTPDNPGAVANVQTNMRRSPIPVLLGALDNPAALSALPARTFRGVPHDGVRYVSGPDTLNLYFDRGSGLLTVQETITDDPILGDRRAEIWMTRWQATGNIQYPRQLDTYWNGRLQAHAVFTAVAVNPETPDSAFAIPDSIARRAQRPNPTPAPLVVTLVELAPGVWRAEGGTHHSLVVDQGARLLVVEAPQTAARSRAVLDTLRSHFPNKPVGLVVNTHHHWDHAGGVRAYLAAGIPVVTHRRNLDFVQTLARAPKTVASDALSRAGSRPPQVRAVDDSLVLGEGASRVVVYRLPTAHVQGILAAYVPSAGLLFQSDVLG